MSLDDPFLDGGKRPYSTPRRVSTFADSVRVGRYQLGSKFVLEVLHGKTIKVMMLAFYISIAIAFYLKIYSENVMETEDICNPFSNCTEKYVFNQTIQFDHEEDMICPTEYCMKFTGVVPSLSLLNKFYFLAVDFGAYESFGRPSPRKRMEFPIEFTGYSHKVSNRSSISESDTTADIGEILPPSNFRQNRSEVQLLCKEGLECDVILFPEPFYQINKPRKIQLVLLDAQMLDPLLPVSPTIMIVYHYWLETFLEVSFRMVATLLVLLSLSYYFGRLGIRSFFKVHDPLKKWLVEQKATVILLLCSILYLQPWKLYIMYKTSIDGLALDGQGFSWEDRVLLFSDVNLPFYFINLLRLYELVVLACCLNKRPKVGFEKRGSVLIIISIWFAVFLLQDFIHLGTDYVDYYTSPTSGLGQQLLGNSIVYTIIILIWVIMLLVLIQKAAANLIKQQYWSTKSRQLSFRFFMVMYMWHVIYNIVTLMYCYYKFSSGRIVLDHLVCNQIVSGHTVADAVNNICFVLILAFMFGPVKGDPDSQPPEAVTRTWIKQKWTDAWIRYVNDNGNATQYFFFWETERDTFIRAQEHNSNHPSRPGMLHNAMQKLREYGSSFTHKIVDQSFSFSERSGSIHSKRSQSFDESSIASEEEAEVEQVKPLFCLELSVDLMMLSWEVYGEEPGDDHSRESEGKMPIDCQRHGYELLEVIHACADGKGKAKGLFEKKLPPDVHHHPVSYRYIPRWTCDHCGISKERTGMCYVCPVATCAVSRDGNPFTLCKDCASKLGKSIRFADEEVLGNSIQPETDGELQVADLQAIICRNDKRIVIAFRGTDNMRNVQTDCQMFRDVVHEMITDKRWELLDFSSWMYRLKRLVGCGLPRCHHGFLRAFQVIGPEVLERLKPILLLNKNHQVCCSGHSLGGALSMLMAYWIRRYLKRKPLVYTYGSPRVGNQTFQKIYDDNIPNTFRIVNQCDVIPHIPIALNGMLFRHCGREVCIDKRGNLIIEPTFIEKFIGPTKHSRGLSGMLTLRSRSLTDHMMLRYAKSLNKICEYFNVQDCTISFTYDKNGKPEFVRARRRWIEDGAPNRCILCKQECIPNVICRYSNNVHVECPEDELIEKSVSPGDRSNHLRKSTVKIETPSPSDNPLLPTVGLIQTESINSPETTTTAHSTIKMTSLERAPVMELLPPLLVSSLKKSNERKESTESNGYDPEVLNNFSFPPKEVSNAPPKRITNKKVEEPSPLSHGVTGLKKTNTSLFVPLKLDHSGSSNQTPTPSSTSLVDSKRVELSVNFSEPSLSNKSSRQSFNKPSSYHITWGSSPPVSEVKTVEDREAYPQPYQQTSYEAAQGALALARLWGAGEEDISVL